MTFKDKNSNVIYHKGDIVDFKKDRVEELLKNNFKLVKKIERKKDV